MPKPGEKPVPEREARLIIESILEAVAYLHSQGIVHRDIKPANVLIGDQADIGGTLVLADFGSAYVVESPPPAHDISTSTGMETICGTPFYLAPELVKGSAYGKAVDVYAVGVTCFQLLFGHTPFQSSLSFATLYHRICNEDIQFPENVISLPGQSFMRSLTSHDAATRSIAEQALRHPWIESSGLLGDEAQDAYGLEFEYEQSGVSVGFTEAGDLFIRGEPRTRKGDYGLLEFQHGGCSGSLLLN
jgi:serine/threonine protein kinase